MKFDLFHLRGRMMMADAGGQGGNMVATTQNFVNAYTGAATAFDANNTMSPEMKTYYNTEALENARPNHVFTQFAKNIALPENHGLTVEVRKANTFPDVRRLTEGVIPDGRQFGYSAIHMTVYQYGDYAALSDRLDLRAVDPVAQDMAEEMGAAGGNTKDKLSRNIALSGSNVMYCPKSNGTAVTTRSALDATCLLTPTVVNRAATWLKKHRAPKINGDYVAIIHPSVAYDLRQSDGWLDVHKYAQPEEIYNGEIGKLHGVRFVESDNAKVFKGSALVNGTLTVASDVSNSVTIPVTGVTLTANALANRYVLIGGMKAKVVSNTTNALTIDYPLTVDAGATIVPGEGGANNCAVYACIFLGKDAFGVIDAEGGNMEMILKDKKQAGGPLEQFSTIGLKMETGGGVLYQERILRVECGSFYSDVDTDEDSVA